MKSYILIIIIFISSCATNPAIQFQPYSMANQNDNDRVFSKNYELNKLKTVFVGEPMVKVKDYYTSTSSGKRLEVVSDSKFPLNVGSMYNICGETADGELVVQIALNLKEFNCNLSLPSNAIFLFGVLVDKYSMENIPQPWAKSSVNKVGELTRMNSHNNINGEMKFKRVEDSAVDVSKGYDNFEIIFSGISNNNTIRTLYREYSSSDLARSDFFQELTYPMDKKTIRFKDITIELISVESDKVSFRVIEDNRS